jgi:integrase
VALKKALIVLHWRENMTVNFKVLIEGYLAAADRPNDAPGRLGFWLEALGDTPITDITADMVDAAMVSLAERGKIQPRRGKEPVATGKPLSGTTLTRYVSQLAGLFKYARKQRLVSRTWTPPTRNMDLPGPAPIKTSYFTAQDIERLVKVARMLDTRWKRMPALIRVAFCTGLRAGNLKELRWEHVDLDAGLIRVDRTKNGHPIVSVLSAAAKAELTSLPGRKPGELVFANKSGQPFHWRKLWLNIIDEGGFKDVTFHTLRHSCGSALASAGVGQAAIMETLNHRTLHASRRYMHLNTSARADIVNRVFG